MDQWWINDFPIRKVAKKSLSNGASSEAMWDADVDSGSESEGDDLTDSDPGYSTDEGHDPDEESVFEEAGKDLRSRIRRESQMWPDSGYSSEAPPPPKPDSNFIDDVREEGRSGVTAHISVRDIHSRSHAVL